MRFRIRLTHTFIRQAKHILKTYPKLDLTLKTFFLSLETNGISGNRLVGRPLFWKDRLPMKPYGIGKSGGMRIVCYFEPDSTLIVPAMIYLKSEMQNPDPAWFTEVAREIAEWQW